MAYFLAKTDPDTYPIERLKSDKKTTWDGVTNAQAVNAIKTMKPGDKVLIYHSGGQSAIVGLAKVVSAPRPDPKNAKSWVVDLEFVQDLEPATTLSEIKSSGLFADTLLVRNGRLSTMALPDNLTEWLKKRYSKSKL